MSRVPPSWGPDGPSAKQREATRLIAGPQRHTLLVGGSRSRKTFTAVRAVCARAIKGAHSRHLIARLRANAARSSISLDTFPKVMRLCFPQVPYDEHRQDGFFEFPNKSEVWVGGLDDKDRIEKILGNEYVTILLNEGSQISYTSRNTVMTRLAQNIPGLTQRSITDLNPVGKSHWTNRLFVQGVDPVNPQRRLSAEERSRYAHLFMNPKDNPTLDPEYLAELMALPERQRKRFFEGVYVDEIEGALWTLEIIEVTRVTKEDVPELERIVVIVDPSGAASEHELQNDEIGLVVVGRGKDKDAYILDDRSLRAGPGVWGKAAVKAYHDWNADAIIAEQNFGGEMVRFVIQAADRNVPVKVITASRGKVIRAEPVSALYEKKRVHHVGSFPVLEDQLCAFSTLGYTADGSPDHADAAIWGVTELLLPAKPGAIHIIEHYKNEAAAKAKEPKPLEAPAKPAVEPRENEQNTTYDLRHHPPSNVSPPPGNLRAGGAAKSNKKSAVVKKQSSFSAALEEQGR